MKTTLAHILLFCYVVGLCKPVSPIIQDVMGHTFFKLAHISEVHFENGHYHLHQELKDAEIDQASPVSTNNQNSKKTVSFLAIHIIPELPNDLFNLFSIVNTVFHIVAYLLLPGITGIIEEPPE